MEIPEYLLEMLDNGWQRLCATIPQPNSYDLLGTESSPWKPLVNEKGVITIETQFTPPDIQPDVFAGVRRTLLTLFAPEHLGFGTFVKPISHECLDGWLPATSLRFRTSRFPDLHELAFVDGDNSLLVRLTADTETAYYRVSLPTETDPRRLWNMPDPQPEQLPDGKRFDAGLARLRHHWTSEFTPLFPRLPSHPLLRNAVLSAFAKSFLTQYDGGMRYGATRYYCDDGRCAESFPPTIFTMISASLHYGLEKKALPFLGRFLDFFVSEKGELLHRGNGASLSEHGMLLDLFGLITDADFRRKYSPAVELVAERLLRLVQKAGDGLIACCPEDDVRDCPPRQWFSCNLWVARGLLSHFRVHTYETQGVPRISVKGEPPLSGDQANSALAREFAKRTVRICRESAIATRDGLFVPPSPDWRKPFADMNDFVPFMPKDDIHSIASYTNYRFYPEMLSSGLLPPDLASAIVQYRRGHGGDFHGATAFRIFRDYPPYARCLDDWPVSNLLVGLAHYGDYREFIRILCGHLALHQSRGTFFAPEMSFRDRLDSTHCVPSQLTVPLALQAMETACFRLQV